MLNSRFHPTFIRSHKKPLFFRRVLSIEARPLWDCLINHFIQLVKHKVMTVKEVAIVFVPCLVSEMSDYQDKVY